MAATFDGFEMRKQADIVIKIPKDIVAILFCEVSLGPEGFDMRKQADIVATEG